MTKKKFEKIFLLIFTGIITLFFSIEVIGTAMNSSHSKGTPYMQRKRKKKHPPKKHHMKPPKHVVEPHKHKKPPPRVVIKHHHYGSIIKAPPTGHRIFTVRGHRYCYHNGVFYWPGESGYAVIAGPVGAG